MTKTYRIKLDFAAAHFLPGYKGLCETLHGHTFLVEFYVTVPKELDPVGIGYDFKWLKKKLKSILPDHTCLNEEYEIHPTAEHIVDHLYRDAQKWVDVEKVVLWESEGSGIEVSNR